MATKITPPTWVSILGSVAVFDLEFVGDISNPTECHLWEIGATSLLTNDRFHVIVDPQLCTIPEPVSGCFALTREFLSTHAVPMEVGLQRFVEWARNYRLFVSHNCFKSDMGVLKGSFARCGIVAPNWMFLDSLLILRQHVKLATYKLDSVYLHYMRTPMQQSHRAMSDADALKHVLIAMGPLHTSIYAYPIRLTPLQNIPGIGFGCEEILVWKGIRSVEEMTAIIVTEHASATLMYRSVMGNTVQRFLARCGLPVQDVSTIKRSILWRINRDYMHKNVQQA